MALFFVYKPWNFDGWYLHIHKTCVIHFGFGYFLLIKLSKLRKKKLGKSNDSYFLLVSFLLIIILWENKGMDKLKCTSNRIFGYIYNYIYIYVYIHIYIFNTPSVAGANLQTLLSRIHSLIDSARHPFPPNLQKKPLHPNRKCNWLSPKINFFIPKQWNI